MNKSFEIDSVKNNTTTKNVDLIKHIAHDLITKYIPKENDMIVNNTICHNWMR